MIVTAANSSDLDDAVACLALAFEADPITGFLLQTGSGYQARVAHFFSLLMRARIALDMPVLVARGEASIDGAAMGYTTSPPAWPSDLVEEWDRFENTIPGLTDRMSVYDQIVAKCKPSAPHYYLGVIGVDPKMHGLGIGRQLLNAFCRLSAEDPISSGVYLETAQPSNVLFYEHAGFAVTGQGNIGSETLWCMTLPQR